MSAPAYFDQWGQEHILTPEGIRRPRQGIFAACIANDHILLSWPKWAPELAELPGGGIDPGENEVQALLREIEEEASVQFPETTPKAVYTQDIRYYCGAVKEFWDYSQTFWRLEGPEIEKHFFEGERSPDDALKARWVPLAQLKDMPFHASHKPALKEIL